MSHGKPFTGNNPSGCAAQGSFRCRRDDQSGDYPGKGDLDKELKNHRLREGDDGLEFVLVWASEAATHQDIVITRKDVAELQMAKSAVHAGATLLMEEFQGEAVKRILLAGAGGNYVDPKDACTIDLFPLPDRENDRRRQCGRPWCLPGATGQEQKKRGGSDCRKTGISRTGCINPFSGLFVSGMFFTSARDFGDEF